MDEFIRKHRQGTCLAAAILRNRERDSQSGLVLSTMTLLPSSKAFSMIVTHFCQEPSTSLLTTIYFDLAECRSLKWLLPEPGYPTSTITCQKIFPTCSFILTGTRCLSRHRNNGSNSEMVR